MPRSAAKCPALDTQQPLPSLQPTDVVQLAHSAPTLASRAPRAQLPSLPRAASGETCKDAELDKVAQILINLCGKEAANALPEPVNDANKRKELWQRKEAKWASVQRVQRERLVQQQQARPECKRPLCDSTASGANHLVCIINGRRAERAY